MTLLLTPRPTSKIPIGEEDALYLFEEIHRARSVAPPYKVVARPSLLRWKKADALAWDNLVIFEQDEGKRYVETRVEPHVP